MTTDTPPSSPADDTNSSNRTYVVIGQVHVTRGQIMITDAHCYRPTEGGAVVRDGVAARSSSTRMTVETACSM